MEKTVTFKNRKGETLFGVVHIPEKEVFGEKRIGVNLLNPGIKYRVAPNRLNIKLARKLCENGYYVFRYDPAGIGDSEGELPAGVFLLDIGEEIQNGLFVQDTIDANDCFIDKYLIDELFLIGNCGGAITSLLTSEVDSRVAAICLIDVPINMRTTKATFADKVVSGGKRADWLLGEYLKKIFSLNSLYRFFSFRTDYRALWKVISMKVQLKLIPSGKGKRRFSVSLEKICNENNLNKRFFKGIEIVFSRKVPVLFVLAGNDPGTEIFQHFFQDGYLREIFPNGSEDDFIEIFLIENANHVYTLIESQESLINKVCKWLDATSASLRYN